MKTCKLFATKLFLFVVIVPLTSIFLVSYITCMKTIYPQKIKKIEKKVTFDFSNIDKHPKKPTVEEGEEISMKKTGQRQQLLKRSLKSRSISLPLQKVIDGEKRSQLVRTKAQYNLKNLIEKKAEDKAKDNASE